MTSMAKKRSTTNSPEREYVFSNDPNIASYIDAAYGFLRFKEHGVPHPLVRWHYHSEFELHLITDTKGKLFLGDYVGNFQPGNLVLVGPNVPHNWISTDVPASGVALRDRVLHFSDTPLFESAVLMPELRDVLGLLEKSHYGIEFFGISDYVAEQFDKIKVSSGTKRLAQFLDLLSVLSHHKDFRILSTVHIQGVSTQIYTHQISQIVDFVSANYENEITLNEVAKQFGMSTCTLSKTFKKATGNTFTDFVNRIRINKACELLASSDRLISTICWEIGFNNIANFNRRFLKIKGMTPKEFRAMSELKFAINSHEKTNVS